jgi:hypothetical protein
MVAILVLNCGNPDDDNYGPIDLSLLSTLTWHDPSYSVGSIEMVQRFAMVFNYNNDTSYMIKAYYGQTISDTLYRFDTSTFTFRTYHLLKDTLVSVDGGTIDEKIITKLTPEELIYCNSYKTSYSQFPRSHKTLVTKGTGANLGKDTVDYHE